MELRIAGHPVEIIVWDSDPVLPVVRAADAGRVGQHGLEIVMAVAQSYEVHREPVGKRITARVALPDDPGGDVTRTASRLRALFQHGLRPAEGVKRRDRTGSVRRPGGFRPDAEDRAPVWISARPGTVQDGREPWTSRHGRPRRLGGSFQLDRLIGDPATTWFLSGRARAATM
jgi:hypothetical protein